MKNLPNSKTSKIRFHQIGTEMKKLSKEGKISGSEKLATEYLEIAKTNTDDWNYGNAIHQANLILGKVALLNGNIIEAKKYLIKAGKTKGSPQLNSFGPNMSLAQKLLEIGEREIVIEFIDLTRKFWNKIFSYLKTRRWKKEIRSGTIPNFGANLNIYECELMTTPNNR